MTCEDSQNVDLDTSRYTSSLQRFWCSTFTFRSWRLNQRGLDNRCSRETIFGVKWHGHAYEEWLRRMVILEVGQFSWPRRYVLIAQCAPRENIAQDDPVGDYPIQASMNADSS